MFYFVLHNEIAGMNFVGTIPAKPIPEVFMQRRA